MAALETNRGRGSDENDNWMLALGCSAYGCWNGMSSLTRLATLGIPLSLALYGRYAAGNAAGNAETSNIGNAAGNLHTEDAWFWGLQPLRSTLRVSVTLCGGCTPLRETNLVGRPTLVVLPMMRSRSVRCS